MTEQNNPVTGSRFQTWYGVFSLTFTGLKPLVLTCNISFRLLSDRPRVRGWPLLKYCRPRKVLSFFFLWTISVERDSNRERLFCSILVEASWGERKKKIKKKNDVVQSYIYSKALSQLRAKLHSLLAQCLRPHSLNTETKQAPEKGSRGHILFSFLPQGQTQNCKHLLPKNHSSAQTLGQCSFFLTCIFSILCNTMKFVIEYTLTRTRTLL